MVGDPPYPFSTLPQQPGWQHQWHQQPTPMDWETRQEFALLKASLHEVNQKLDAILSDLGLRDRLGDPEVEKT